MKSMKYLGFAAVEAWSKLSLALPLPSKVSSAACKVLRLAVGSLGEKPNTAVLSAPNCSWYFGNEVFNAPEKLIVWHSLVPVTGVLTSTRCTCKSPRLASFLAAAAPK